MDYYMYLRKSRADQEAELRGEGETLARHEKTLRTLAKAKNLNVTKVYREVVSGETISSRPEMKKLLTAVEQGDCAGVLVMEVERLARGDTKDQGIVAETFKYSNTKIITPIKTYDPNNEFDEEYFEFGLFMSRREFKTINRRIQRGRLASVQEGKYIASSPPYGYERIKIKDAKGYTLKIIPSEAKIVKYIFDLYVNGELQPDGTRTYYGASIICQKLDNMNVAPPRGKEWSPYGLREILKNDVYTGKIRWGYRPQKKSIIDGKLVLSQPISDTYALYEGLHDSIIDQALFDAAQKVMSQNRTNTTPINFTLKNPLTGLIYCAKCGRLMTRMSSCKNPYAFISCPNRHCNNVSAPLDLVEKKLISAFEEWLENYKLENKEKNLSASSFLESSKIKKESIDNIEKDLHRLNLQLDKTFDLFEQGIYDNDTFMKRKDNISGRITELTDVKTRLLQEYESDMKRISAEKELIPAVEKIIEGYEQIEDAKTKNVLLKEVLEKAVYEKNERNTRGKRDVCNFSLKIYPRIPSDS